MVDYDVAFSSKVSISNLIENNGKLRKLNED